VSNALKYDALLVRELARELDRTLAGASLEAVFFDREQLRVTIQTAPDRRRDDAPPSLLWQLHPRSGHLTAAPAGTVGGRVPLRPRAVIAGISAPPDERIVVIELQPDEAAAGAARHIIIELLPNQWNAIATAVDGRIVAVLRERTTRERTLRAGSPYAAPTGTSRRGATDTLDRTGWFAALGDVPPGERLAALTRFAAYTSPLNAAWIIGDADVMDTTAALNRALDRYLALVSGPTVPVLLDSGAGCWQPYVAVAAPGVDPPAETVASLLEAFRLAADRSAAGPLREAAAEQALAVIEARLAAARTRLRRLEAERAGAAEEAARLRHQADLLLSQLHVVFRGMERVELDDLDGGTIEVELDPRLSGSDNAQRMYATARRRARAAARIPDLLRAGQRRIEDLDALAARTRAGGATPAQIAGLLAGRDPRSRSTGPAMPYRTYRSTGGLEIRVGRGSRANDELTFRHSSPNDIWLHARDVAGAHVILRWPRGDANPPARDVAEAAVLAALASRARSSATVPVDWTRRKYVRKPRKAGPGVVVPERVRTVFVQPDSRLEERLRVESVAS
jgi:predicted ribosome quality control (RQC) complex YloA/Tae2 family protein